MNNQFPFPLPPLPSLPYIPPGLATPVVIILAVLLIIAAVRMLESFVKDFPAALAIIGLVVIFVIVVWLVYGNRTDILRGFQQLTGPIFKWK